MYTSALQSVVFTYLTYCTLNIQILNNFIYSFMQISASLPNMTKNGDSFECWFGNQLYNTVVMGMTLSHSLCLVMCFARHLLKNL